MRPVLLSDTVPTEKSQIIVIIIIIIIKRETMPF